MSKENLITMVKMPKSKSLKKNEDVETTCACCIFLDCDDNESPCNTCMRIHACVTSDNYMDTNMAKEYNTKAERE